MKISIVSECCGVEYRTFHNRVETFNGIVTNYYVCDKCGNKCETKFEEPKKIRRERT